jgi:NhaA family Na+:H+ antiporter
VQLTAPATTDIHRPVSVLRGFLDNSVSGGLVLMGTAALALIVANSPLASIYFGALHAYFGPLSIQHWINDALTHRRRAAERS